MQVIERKIPKYSELSPSKLWVFVQECPDLLQYFPDMKAEEVPERDYMFKILSTLRREELKILVKDARKQRSICNKSNEKNLIEINPKIRDKLLELFPQKSKSIGKKTELQQPREELLICLKRVQSFKQPENRKKSTLQDWESSTERRSKKRKKMICSQHCMLLKMFVANIVWTKILKFKLFLFFICKLNIFISDYIKINQNIANTLVIFIWKGNLNT